MCHMIGTIRRGEIEVKLWKITKRNFIAKWPASGIAVLVFVQLSLWKNQQYILNSFFCFILFICQTSRKLRTLHSTGLLDAVYLDFCSCETLPMLLIVASRKSFFQALILILLLLCKFISRKCH